MKRQYFKHIRHAEGKDQASIDKVAAALVRFEMSTNFKPFKAFHIDQAVAFKKALGQETNPRTRKRLAKSTQDATLRAVKSFIQWLSYQPGYKSRIRLPDAEYFNLSTKDKAVAHAHRDIPFPSMEQALYACREMPNGTDIEKRNKALFSFFVLSGIRAAAAASLKLKHVDLVEGRIVQDAQEVRTKASKTIYTTLAPVAEDILGCFHEWVTHLRKDLLFGPDDPLFPKTAITMGVGRQFAVSGLTHEHWKTTAPIRIIVGDAFVAAGIERFGAHSFRKTLEHWGAARITTPEAFKAFSQNLGHDSVLTTFTNYGKVSLARQAEIIKGMAAQEA